MKIQLLAAGTVFSLALAAFAAPEDPLLPIYVDPVNGSDDNNGYTWDTAMKTIAAANAKTEDYSYYSVRRCQVILRKGTYVLDSTLTLKPRTSIMGDPDYDRTETVLTAPAGATVTDRFIQFGNINSDFFQTIANLTVSNVVKSGDAAIYCGTGGDKDAYIISNVLFTCCKQINGSAVSAAALYSNGNLVAVDCEFSGLTNTTSYGSVALCRGGGIFRRCYVHDCYNNGDGQIRAWIGAYDHLSDTRYLVENCTFSNNVAQGSAGCLYNIPTIIDSEFYDKEAKGAGSVISCADDTQWYFYTNHTAKVMGCTFKRNRTKTTDSSGSAVYFSANGVVSNCTFEGNSSPGYCSCVCNATAILDSTFITNVASRAPAFSTCYFSSAVDYAKADPVVRGCTFIGNTAKGSGSNGGALYFKVLGLVEKCAFTNNVAAAGGGAVYAEATDSRMTVRDCTFSGNHAVSGGALVRVGTILGSTFFDNTADNGGAYHSGSMYSPVISNCLFSGNGATSRGGGIFFTQNAKLNDARVVDCVFTNNMAGGTGNYMGGGAIYAWIENGTAETGLTVRNCLLVGNVLTNTAAAGCGSAAILMSRSVAGNAGRIFMENCTVYGNRSMNGNASALYVWPGGGGYGDDMTFFTNTLVAATVGADGSLCRAIWSVWELPEAIRRSVGYCYFHPKLVRYGDVVPFDEDQHMISTDVAPKFQKGTFVPKKGYLGRDMGIVQPWMAGAFDLHRDEDGLPDVPRSHDGLVSIGAYEYRPSGLGLMLLVR